MCFPLTLSSIGRYENDFHCSLCQIYIRVEILQGLQHVLARGTPIGRKEKTDILETLESFGCYGLSKCGLLALTLRLTALLNEL